MCPSRRLVRRSPLLLLVCVMCLGTGFGLLGIARTMTVAGPESTVPAASSALATVFRYYDAANEVLKTGDAAGLEAVLGRGFVDHDPAPGLGSDRDGLMAALLARH